MIENHDIKDVISIIDLEKINRFSRILDQNLKNDKVIKFYNEILDEIERLVNYIAIIEEDNIQ